MRNARRGSALALAITGVLVFASVAYAINLTGTAGPDRLIGTPGADTILGLGGDDTIIGLPGNDNLQGGPGNDRVTGDGLITCPPGATNISYCTFNPNTGSGNDTITGGSGNDNLTG